MKHFFILLAAFSILLLASSSVFAEGAGVEWDILNPETETGMVGLDNWEKLLTFGSFIVVGRFSTHDSEASYSRYITRFYNSFDWVENS